MKKNDFNTIAEAIEDIANGKMVIVIDDEDRENEGDLVMAAHFATPEAINFMMRLGECPNHFDKGCWPHICIGSFCLYLCDNSST